MEIEGRSYYHPHPQGGQLSAEQNFLWRIANFENGLKYYGVLTEQEGRVSYHPEALAGINNLGDLRLMYGLSLPWTRNEKYLHSEQYGSIIITPLLNRAPQTFVDVQDVSKTAQLKRGYTMWDLDFIPFSNFYGMEGTALESMYLGNLDITRLIAAKKDKPDNASVLHGITNAINANFVMKRWNFHLYNALTKSTDEKYGVGEITDPNTVEALFQENLTNTSFASDID